MSDNELLCILRVALDAEHISLSVESLCKDIGTQDCDICLAAAYCDAIHSGKTYADWLVSHRAFMARVGNVIPLSSELALKFPEYFI